jgi:hypothetical protein
MDSTLEEFEASTSSDTEDYDCQDMNILDIPVDDQESVEEEEEDNTQKSRLVDAFSNSKLGER